MKTLFSVDEVKEMIRSGKPLLLAGDESALKQLIKGNWIGGTIPYFMSEDGGVKVKDKLHVTTLPDFVQNVSAKFYTEETLPSIADDCPENGISFIIIPASTPIHQAFAKDVSNYKDIFSKPLIGWIAGVDLDELGSSIAKVINGQDGVISAAKAVVLHVELPEDLYAKIDIVNLFKQGEGDVITFEETGFVIEECFVNGEKRNFAEYIQEKDIDIKLPLVADYSGAMINVSFQSVENGKVSLYAPVFTGVDYKVATPLSNYEEQFDAELAGDSISPVFSCNCILNYLHANLEGKKTGDIVGPITFGEVAYILLNQTMVYVTFEKK